MHKSIPINLPSTILPIKAFKDNYIWIIHRNNYAIIVDPGEADPVINFITQASITPEAIFITHHHYDHIDGVKKIVSCYPNINVYGPADSGLPFQFIPVKENDILKIDNAGLEYKVIEIPGHTLDHIAYLDNDVLFCGDTLFGCGCGKLFEGTAEQMFNYLKKIKNLNRATKIYCGHEYTLNNIKFAMTEEAENLELFSRYQKVVKQKITVPTTLSEELTTNPFMRTINSQELKKLRERKDAF